MWWPRQSFTSSLTVCGGTMDKSYQRQGAFNRFSSSNPYSNGAILMTLKRVIASHLHRMLKWRHPQKKVLVTHLTKNISICRMDTEWHVKRHRHQRCKAPSLCKTFFITNICQLKEAGQKKYLSHTDFLTSYTIFLTTSFSPLLSHNVLLTASFSHRYIVVHTT